MHYYLLMWKKGLNFSSRSTRAEYWFPMLVNTVIIVLCYAIYIALNYEHLRAQPIDIELVLANFLILQVVVGIYGIVSFLPMLSLTIRRLHDIGRTGFWLLYTFVFGLVMGLLDQMFENDIVDIIVGLMSLGIIILWIVFFMTRSQSGTNKYGANPLEIASVNAENDNFK